MTSAANLYSSVINDVIQSVRDSFLDEGIDEGVLQASYNTVVILKILTENNIPSRFLAQWA